MKAQASPFKRVLHAAAGLATAAVMAFASAAEARSVGTLSVKPTTLDGAIHMVWTGPVGAPMAKQISDAFEENKGKAKRVVFEIASGGGSVAEGERVIQVLRNIRKTHTLDTVVETARMCGSMCVFIYLQGERRFAGLSSLWLFHEVSVSDEKTGEIKELNRAAWQRLVSLYYPPAGVSAEWTKRMAPYTINSDYWQTGADLARERSGVFHFAIDNQKERTVMGRPKPAPAKIAAVPPPGTSRTELPRSAPLTAEPPPRAEPPRAEPPRVEIPKETPVAPLPPPVVEKSPEHPRIAERPAPTASPRILVEFETKMCRRLDQERSIYVNVPCEQASAN